MIDTDLKFSVPTTNPMLFVYGEFKSFDNFYLAVLSGFGSDSEILKKVSSDIRNYYLKRLN